jgi:hypothetical protein
LCFDWTREGAGVESSSEAPFLSRWRPYFFMGRPHSL